MPDDTDMLDRETAIREIWRVMATDELTGDEDVPFLLRVLDSVRRTRDARLDIALTMLEQVDPTQWDNGVTGSLGEDEGRYRAVETIRNLRAANAHGEAGK